MKHADLAGHLMSVMEDIEAGIASLRHWMTFDGIDQCRVFRLPDVPAGAEEIEPERIDPVPVDGDEAIDLALAALGKFGTGDGLSTRCVYRLPGALSVSTDDPQRLLDQVDSINKLKSVFDAIGQRITDDQERFDILHRCFPGYVYLQVIRKLHVVVGPVRSVTFTWGRKPSSQLISVERADAKLEWAARHPTPKLLAELGVSEDGLKALVQRERDYLASLDPDTPIRYRRELRVRPLANLLFAEGAPVARLQREAHSPIIVLNAPEMRIGHFKPYDARLRAQRKSRRGLDARASGRPISRVRPLFL